MPPLSEKITGNKVLMHLLFCLLLLALLFTGRWILSVQGFNVGDSSSITARFLFFIICMYTGRWLCMRFYLNSKLAVFIASILLSFIAVSAGWLLIVQYVLGHRYADFTEVVINDMPFFIIGLGLGILIKLIRYTIQKEVQNARAQAEQKEMELNLLQSQLSPHFLFNTLNNMYSIAIVQHQLLPGLLLKLSELLRYTVYDTRRTFLPLQEELAYINNYIDFEKIRIGDRLSLQLDMEKITDPTLQVPPMVLIVFIENAFKHARNTFDEKIHISITLQATPDQIVFAVRNSCGSVASEKNRHAKASGLGLANTVKRLDLLYKDRYTLQHVLEDEYYNIHLSLPVKTIV